MKNKVHMEYEILFLEGAVKIQEVINTLIDEHQLDPMQIAGILQASAARIYKQLLSPDEFERLMHHVVESTQSLDEPDYQDLANPTIH